MAVRRAQQALARMQDLRAAIAAAQYGSSWHTDADTPEIEASGGRYDHGEAAEDDYVDFAGGGR